MFMMVMVIQYLKLHLIGMNIIIFGTLMKNLNMVTTYQEILFGILNMLGMIITIVLMHTGKMNILMILMETQHL